MMHEEYGWTKREIDNSELSYLLDLLVVKIKVLAACDIAGAASVDVPIDAMF